MYKAREETVTCYGLKFLGKSKKKLEPLFHSQKTYLECLAIATIPTKGLLEILLKGSQGQKLFEL